MPRERRRQAIARLNAALSGLPHLQTRQLSVGGAGLRLTAVRNPQSLVQRAQLEVSEGLLGNDLLPYWSELWPSAVALGRHIVRHNAVNSAMRVLELGCGTGFVGVVCGRGGAEVILTDREPRALQLAALNWWRNIGTTPQLCRLDWTAPPPLTACEMVVAADIAYDERLFAPLRRLLQLAVAPGGRLLLSEPNRPIAGEFLLALRRDFDLRDRVDRVVHLAGRRDLVTILDYERRSDERML